MDISQLKSMSIQRGSVFRMELFPKDGVTSKNVGDISRNKYFVVLGVEQEKILVGSLLINTDINISKIHIIAPYQHCIYPETYDFLADKFRYVDCYLVKELLYERIMETAEYIGFINEEDMSKIVKLTLSSPANKPYILQKYGVE